MIRWLLTLTFCLITFLWLAKALLIGYYPDFLTQYYAPQLIFQGVNPYMGGKELFTNQVYPPTSIFFFAPFSFLPIEISATLYTFLSIVSLGVSLFLLTRIFNLKFFGALNLFLMGLVFVSFPVKFTLGMGQVNMFILLILTLSLYFLYKKQEFLSGIFLGISIAIKLFPLFVPIYLLIEFKKGNRGLLLPWTRVRLWVSRKKILEDLELLDGILVAILILVAVVFLFFPKDLIFDFVFKTLPGISSSWKLDYYNQALSGFLGRLFGMGSLANILKISISLIITVVSLFILTKNKDNSFYANALKFGTLITLSLIVNTFSWQHHFAWMIIPFYATLYYLRNLKSNYKFYLLLFFAYLLVSINLRYPESVPVILQSHVFYGTLIVLILNLFLLTKKDKSVT